MPMDPKLMAMMGGGAGPGGQAGAGLGAGGAGGPAAPVSSPMSLPQENEGEKQAAMVKVQQAMDLLEMALHGFGVETDEGGAVYDTLGKLRKQFGGSESAKAKELMPAEIMNLMAALPRGPGGMKPPGLPGAPPGGGAPMPPVPPTM